MDWIVVPQSEGNQHHYLKGTTSGPSDEKIKKCTSSPPEHAATAHMLISIYTLLRDIIDALCVHLREGLLRPLNGSWSRKKKKKITTIRHNQVLFNLSGFFSPIWIIQSQTSPQHSRYMLHLLTSSSSSSLSSNATPLADGLGALCLVNDDDKDADLQGARVKEMIKGSITDIEYIESATEDECSMAGCVTFLLFIMHWTAHTHFGGGRVAFLTGISSSESSMITWRWREMPSTGFLHILTNGFP